MSESREEQQLDEVVKGLPLEEKVPVLVLKKLLEERKEINRKREAEVDQIQAKYRDLMKPNILRSSEIIKGAPIKEDQLKDKEKYFNAAEINHYQQHAKGSKIKHYWAAVFENSKLEEFINDEDRNCLSALEDLSFTASADNMQVVFEFSDNPFFAAGKYSRQLILANGIPTECKGDTLKWKPGKSLVEAKPAKKQPKNQPARESFFKLFTNTKAENDTDVELIQRQAAILSEIVNDLVPWSLEYYLGLVDNDDSEEDEYEDEDDDDEEEDQPRKQVHKS